MTNSQDNSLSALIDGEASEIEVHRLVRVLRNKDLSNDSLNHRSLIHRSLIHRWAVYRHIGSIIRAIYGAGHQAPQAPQAPQVSPVSTDQPLSPAEHQLLYNRISTAIQEETEHHAASSKYSWQRKTGVIGGSLAVAASLTLAVFIGFPTPAPDTGLATGTPSTQEQTSTPYQLPRIPLSNPALVVPTPELVELDEAKQRQLRAYFDQHDRLVRMNAEQQSAERQNLEQQNPEQQQVNYPAGPPKNK